MNVGDPVWAVTRVARWDRLRKSEVVVWLARPSLVVSLGPARVWLYQDERLVLADPADTYADEAQAQAECARREAGRG